MSRTTCFLLAGLFGVASGGGALAQSRYVLETKSASQLSGVLSRNDLTLVRAVRENERTIYQVSSRTALTAGALKDIARDPGVRAVESDQDVRTPETATNTIVPSLASLIALWPPTSEAFYGSTVRTGYVHQPAVALIRAAEARSQYGAGAGVVAIIDTGVDPTHPALKNVLVPGFDFTRNQAGSASELADLTQSTVAILDQSTVAILDRKVFPSILNQSTVAILDQSTVAILDGGKLPAAFGHGTMVAGLVHLVAPGARIMPLKAFRADGSASLADIIRAVYYAVDHGASILQMSFSLTSQSPELADAINYAWSKGVICVSSAGNGGREVHVYPASLKGVFGVGSTDNSDRRSRFSNYGDDSAKASAPGEAVITTYPGNNYAAAWGTSFSAPLVAGAIALMNSLRPGLSYSKIQDALENGVNLHQDMGARLDAVLALQSVASGNH